MFEEFSFEFESSSPRESKTGMFLKTATIPTFPFLHITLKKDETNESGDLELSVNPKVYELIKTSAFTNELFVYAETNGQFGFWGYDMILGLKILAKLEIFEKFPEWIKKSRRCISDLMENKKYEAKFTLEFARDRSIELLNAIKIKDKVDNKKIIDMTIKEAKRGKNMDASTMIYRLAMAIYHSNRNTDKSII